MGKSLGQDSLPVVGRGQEKQNPYHFRAEKPNLATQIINLKGHFTLLQWTQMLHFTLGKRYF